VCPACRIYTTQLGEANRAVVDTLRSSRPPVGADGFRRRLQAGAMPRWQGRANRIEGRLREGVGGQGKRISSYSAVKRVLTREM